MALPAVNLNVSAADEILSAYNTENLRRSLAQYPGRIYDARQAVNQARKALKDAEFERDMAQAEIVFFVSIETDEKGKPKYTNVQMRDAEITRRKAADPIYAAAAGKVAKAEAKWVTAQDALQMLLDEYQSARIVARLITGELGVISGLADYGEIDDSDLLVPTRKEAF